jgi:putative phage-type endonuclease
MLTKEEIEFRRTKIGASDAASILGISPWKNKRSLWREKVLGEETVTNRAMMRGNELEPLARYEFEKMTGIRVMPKLVINKHLPWQIANLDGITFDEDVFVEIKCPNKEVHAMAKDGKIPSYYYCQLQHQLCVTNLDRAYYFSFNGEEGAVVEIQKNDQYIEDLLKEELEFLKLIMTKQEPYNCYVSKVDTEWEKLAQEYRALVSLEERKEQLKKQLIELSSGFNSEGFGVKVTKRQRAGNIDYKSIPELNGLDLEKYRKHDISYFEVSLG